MRLIKKKKKKKKRLKRRKNDRNIADEQKARTETALNGLSLFFSISSETFFGQRAVPLLDSLSLFSFSPPPSRSLSPCVSLGEFNFLPLQCLRSPLLSRSLTEAACHFQRVKHAYARVRSTWLAGFTCA